MAFHAASRSICVELCARRVSSACALRSSPRCRRSAYSGMASTRRYIGLTNRREVGRYGRGFHRCGGRRRVQRVDQHVARAVPRRRPHREVGQVRQIADAPGPLGPDAVELGGQAPRRPLAQPGGQPSHGGSDDERGAALPGAAAQVQAVIAQRQIGGQREGGLADHVGRRDRMGQCSCRAGAGRSARVPSSSRTQTWAASPWVTCTQNAASVPARATMVGGSARLQCSRSWRASAAARSSAVAAGTPSAPSTAISVCSGTSIRWPTQSSYSVATPNLRASSTSARVLRSHARNLASSRALRRARADRPRCHGVPPGGPRPRTRTPPGSAGRRCTGWTSCSSRPR